jgi:hypothetical protein
VGQVASSTCRLDRPEERCRLERIVRPLLNGSLFKDCQDLLILTIFGSHALEVRSDPIAIELLERRGHLYISLISGPIDLAPEMLARDTALCDCPRIVWQIGKAVNKAVLALCEA